MDQPAALSGAGSAAALCQCFYFVLSPEIFHQFRIPTQLAFVDLVTDRLVGPQLAV
jgi:hypothetical protein